MRYVFVAVAFALAIVASSSGQLAAARSSQQTAPGPAASSTQYRALLDQYCVTCHNQRSKTANVMFDTMDLANLSKDAKTWERAVRKLRGGMMPPPGARQPERATVEKFASWLETSLDDAAASHPNPGYVAVHRLNRAEYANAIDDILGLHVDATALLPTDDISSGFDNIANVLKVSPAFLDQYITAARFVATQAIGEKAPKPLTSTLRPATGIDQSTHIEGLPLGTRGGLLAEHMFPADGEYRFTITGLPVGGYGGGLEYEHTLIITIDGLKVFSGKIGGEEDRKALDQQQARAATAMNQRFQNIPVAVKAGPHKVGVTFVARTYAVSDNVLKSFTPGGGVSRIVRIGSVDVAGPFSPAGIQQTPSRNRIFVCHPASTTTKPEDDLACATQILTNVARRAFRRPVTEHDLAAPLQFYRAARSASDFDSGIKDGLTSILASPKFLYRTEDIPDNVAPGSNYSINDLELASRLSFFLWSRIPDDELVNVASQGKLKDPAILEKQIQRMLADPKSKSSLVTNFAFQWLNVRGIDGIDPDGFIFPTFDANLRNAFRREMELFIESIIREDRNVTDFLTANYTFLNERLALHYGMRDVRGDQFRRVTLTDENRFGLLGKGSVLMVTSYANRTAPVIRGAYILENIMGTPPSPPPPDVEGFQENKEGAKQLTVREIMQLHRSKPSCNACHGVMDPLGFALENFDAVGSWRSKDIDAGTPIDAAGQLVDGTPVSGPVDLRKALMKHPEQFVQTLTEKLMTYGLGRGLEYYDMPAVRKIVRDAARDDYRFSSIVKGIVNSQPFRMKRVPETASN
jgi:mono/diheme cytochrome c family protein